jgi:hypothetical protein
VKWCAVCGQPIRDKRPRSTGRYSQSNHLHGHLQQLAEHCGYHLNEMKAVMKEAVTEWPRKRVSFGGKTYNVPISEAEASVVEESAAIEWCHHMAAELQVVLREDI